MSKSFLTLISIFLILIVSVNAQEKKKVILKDKIQDNAEKDNSIQDAAEGISFKNSTGNPILTVTAEGENAGSILIPPLSSIGNNSNKLYNFEGNLHWNGSQIGSGFSLPYTGSVNSHPEYALTLSNTGGAGAGKFIINVADPHTNGENAVNASTNGVGMAIYGENLGTGDAAGFYINNALNERYAIGGGTLGLGTVAYFENQNSQNSNPTLDVKSNGLGHAAIFTLDGNGDNYQAAVYVSNVGPGAAIQAKPWGSGPAILAEGLVDMDYIRVGLDAPPGKVLTCDGQGYGSWQDPQGIFSLPYSGTHQNGSDAFSLTNNGSGRCGYFRIDNPDNNLWALDVWTNGTGDAFKAQTEGTRDAGRFEINNLTNNRFAVYAITYGLGSAGLFEIQNTENSSSALVASTVGSGHAIQANGSVEINGKLNINSDQIRIQNQYTPSSPDDTNGEEGDITWDDGYVYVKTTGGWKRAQLNSW